MKIDSIYVDIVNDVDNPVGIVFNHSQSLNMRNHYNPWSIKYPEFKYLYDTIKNNNLKAGYEVATAFGISALAAALAMKDTGGKLVTMDAYIEEKYNDAGSYTNADKEVYYENNDGYKNVNYLIKKFQLEGTLLPEIGWSPNDTEKVLSKHFDLQKEKLDYIFIDAGHWDDAVIKDIDSVVPFLAERCYIFFHDVHCFTDKFKDHLISRFGKSFEIVVPLPIGFNLAILIK